MLKVAAITNHELASTNYWDQLEQIAASDVDFIVLREKNLSEEEYTDYAKRALRLCSIHQKTCILQHFGKAAIRLHIPRFQCSLPYLETHSSLLYYMTTLGVSVHTVEEAVKAEQLGATYLMASHVFPTACAYRRRHGRSHLQGRQDSGLCLRRRYAEDHLSAPGRPHQRRRPHVGPHDLPGRTGIFKRIACLKRRDDRNDPGLYHHRYAE